MSQKSNSRKSQRGGVSHHEMKRGLNNWGRRTPFADGFDGPAGPINTDGPRSLSTQTADGAIGKPGVNIPVQPSLENLPKKQKRGLVL